MRYICTKEYDNKIMIIMSAERVFEPFQLYMVPEIVQLYRFPAAIRRTVTACWQRGLVSTFFIHKTWLITLWRCSISRYNIIHPRYSAASREVDMLMYCRQIYLHMSIVLSHLINSLRGMANSAFRHRILLFNCTEWKRCYRLLRHVTFLTLLSLVVQ